MNDALFSSKSDEWTTPKEVFNELNNEFRFDIDVASTDENALCKRHFTESENGLLQDWGGVFHMVQSTVFQHQRVGAKSIRRTEQREENRAFDSIQNGHKMVSRVYLWGCRGSIHKGAVEVFRLKELCSVSVNDCYLQEGRN